MTPHWDQLDDEPKPQTCGECKCYSCDKTFANDDLVWDEGDIQWCIPCIEKWEAKNQEDWATGQPLKSRSSCGECGHTGYHHPNCPIGDGDAGNQDKEEE